MGAGRKGRTLFPAQPGSAMLAVTCEPGKEAGDVCLRGDMHRKRCQVAVIDASGRVLTNRNVPDGAEPSLTVIGGLPPGTPAASGAEYGTSWLAGAAGGLRVSRHLVHPSRCKAVASAGLNNDKAGAAILGQLLSADLLPEAWIVPLAIGQLRALATGSTPCWPASQRPARCCARNWRRRRLAASRVRSSRCRRGYPRTAPRRTRSLPAVWRRCSGRDRAALRGRVCVGPAGICAELLSGFAEAGCGRVHLWPLGAEGRQVDLTASKVLPGIRP
jgi:hypothetical protein